MGFIKSSTTIQLYAYFTEYARERIFNGDVIDFQIKNFSLHDEDIDYKISKEIIGVDSSGNTLYNTLKSGFIPDITGDNDVCIKSNKSTIILGKNTLKDGIPSMSANFSQNCSTTVEYVIFINVTNPTGGAGGPYTWRAVPVFPNGTPQSVINNFYTDFGPDDFFTPKQIGQQFEFFTRDAQITIPIYYQVYLKDSQGTEKLIGQSNLDCLPSTSQNNILFSQSSSLSDVAIVGGSSNNPILTSPSYYNTISVSLENENGTQVTTNVLNSAYFKIEKLNLTNLAWNYIDLVIGANVSPFLEVPITTNLLFNFNNNTNGNVQSFANNTLYTKTVPIKVIRKTLGTTKPSGSISLAPILQQGSITFRVYSDYINPLYTETLTIPYRYWIWT